ncbi:hypothetical protein ODJ79_38190 [Actinoplanes sp. KI2]|uniref:hypothetical protein n=1 Tax=Actinoplanes sp. KI2 TaxID=2983315 RepID=UPI0021D601E6|nr:hypothetical protein [Actinoplanes sp. KI2]MCU7729582.1 hypothetical protein [Actinoplanes sp. KI2]
MGFWGTVVVAKSPVLLAHRADVLGFGYQHDEVRDLGQGWQVLVTRGWQDPPDLAAAGRRLVAGTSEPVLAAYVCDGDCAAIFARCTTEWTFSAHLPPGEDDCGYKHRPKPPARTAAEVTADLVAWGEAAGLTPDRDRLLSLVASDSGADAYRRADHVVFDLLPALGFAAVGPPHPKAFAIHERPYSYLVDFFGLGTQARSRAVVREQWPDEIEPDEVEQPWEAAAVQLEFDLWAAVHHTDPDVAALKMRIDQVRAEYDRCRAEYPPAPEHVEINGSAVHNAQSVMQQLYDGHVSGHVNPPPTACG